MRPLKILSEVVRAVLIFTILKCYGLIIPKNPENKTKKKTMWILIL